MNKYYQPFSRFAGVMQPGADKSWFVIQHVMKRFIEKGPESMHDITDATESPRAIFVGLNKEWISKQDDFFVELPINFVTAIIWFLRKYKDGIY